MGCLHCTITPPPPRQHLIRWHPFVNRYLGGERFCESKMSCPRTHHNVPVTRSTPPVDPETIALTISPARLHILKEHQYLLDIRKKQQKKMISRKMEISKFAAIPSRPTSPQQTFPLYLRCQLDNLWGQVRISHENRNKNWTYKKCNAVLNGWLINTIKRTTLIASAWWKVEKLIDFLGTKSVVSSSLQCKGSSIWMLPSNAWRSPEVARSYVSSVALGSTWIVDLCPKIKILKENSQYKPSNHIDYAFHWVFLYWKLNH